MAFQTKKPIKSVKPDEEEFDEQEEDYDEEESEEEQIKKAVSDEPKRQKQEVSQESKITVNEVLLNHEDRIKSIEAALFRLSRI